jgi:hypothetical protein
MREILQMLVDIAAETQKARFPNKPELYNKNVQLIREAYDLMDHHMLRPAEADPVDLREAISIADFPLYFGTAISRSFYADYAVRTGQWRDYVFEDEVPDFRPVQRGRMSEMGTLAKRRDQGEAKRDYVEESQLQYSVEEYADAFALSWRVIVNDDLSEVRRFPTKLLNAATRFENSFVSNLYDNATSQAGLAALGATYSAAGALSIANLIVAFNKFLTRVDSRGNPLEIRPKYLVTSPVLELAVQEILAGFDPSATNPLLPRVTKNMGIQWRGDPYIGNTAHWYLMADPAEIPSVTVARLRGYSRPQVYLKAPNAVPFSPGGSLGSASWLTGNFEHGEIEFQVLDIIGGWTDATYAGVTDYQGILHMTG